MDEKAWAACGNPGKMLRFLQTSGMLSDRKARLFACACCRRIWHLLIDERSGRAVEVTELNADGNALDDELAEACDQANQAWTNARLWAGQLQPGEARRAAVREAQALQVPVWAAETQAARRSIDWAAAVMVLTHQALASRLPGTDLERQARRLREQHGSCDLLHDLFGNPSRPPPPIPASVLQWNEGLVRQLAAAAYDQRQLPSGHLDNVRLAVLADAISEAGCDDADIIGHLRRPGAVHVRGCAVLDLLLNKG